jgi:hypothetical protein
MGDIPDDQEPCRHPQWTPFGRSLGKDPESGVNGIAPVRVVWLTGRYLCMLESPVQICLSAELSFLFFVVSSVPLSGSSWDGLR